MIVQFPSKNTENIIIKPQYIIIHCIGGLEKDVLTLLSEPKPKGGGVSAHYLVTEQGLIYELVAPDKIAYHAGKSEWQGIKNLNYHAIGIEFHSPNYANALQKTLDWFHFEPFTSAQVQSGISLIKTLMQQFSIPKENIIAHSDIAPWRLDSNDNVILGKTDPGALFPWEELAKIGIGIWPNDQKKQTTLMDIDACIRYAQQLLNKIGYPLLLSGELDQKSLYTIQAFQLHFMPNQVDATISNELITRLENLADKNYKY